MTNLTGNNSVQTRIEVLLKHVSMACQFERTMRQAGYRKKNSGNLEAWASELSVALVLAYIPEANGMKRSEFQAVYGEVAIKVRDELINSELDDTTGIV